MTAIRNTITFCCFLEQLLEPYFTIAVKGDTVDVRNDSGIYRITVEKIK